jgi:PilZ domain
MPFDKQRRSSTRKARDHGAWITMDGDVRSHECHVLDVSARGAKLVADLDAQVGSSLRLSIARQSIVRKPCMVVWRKGRQIGVTFSE